MLPFKKQRSRRPEEDGSLGPVTFTTTMNLEDPSWRKQEEDICHSDEDGIYEDADMVSGTATASVMKEASSFSGTPKHNYSQERTHIGEDDHASGNDTNDGSGNIKEQHSTNDDDDNDVDSQLNVEDEDEHDSVAPASLWDAKTFLLPQTWRDNHDDDGERRMNPHEQRLEEQIQQALEGPLERLQQQGDSMDVGGSVYLRWREQQLDSTSTTNAPGATSNRETMTQQLLADATIEASPREYQRMLLERARQQNTIVHLGTGYGKTLIALLLIKEQWFKQQTNSSTDDAPLPPQTLFLVPSVALAIQQSMSLRANLPFTVATACYDTSKTDEYRAQLQQAQILVATHGAVSEVARNMERSVRGFVMSVVFVSNHFCHPCLFSSSSFGTC